MTLKKNKNILKIKALVFAGFFLVFSVFPPQTSFSSTQVTWTDFVRLAPNDKLEEVGVLLLKKMFRAYSENNMNQFMQYIDEKYTDTRGMRAADMALSFQNDHDLLNNIRLELVGVDKVTITRGNVIKLEIQYRWRSVLTDKDTGTEIKVENNISVAVFEVKPDRTGVRTAGNFFGLRGLKEAYADEASDQQAQQVNNFITGVRNKTNRDYADPRGDNLNKQTYDNKSHVGKSQPQICAGLRNGESTIQNITISMGPLGEVVKAIIISKDADGNCGPRTVTISGPAISPGDVAAFINIINPPAAAVPSATQTSSSAITSQTDVISSGQGTDTIVLTTNGQTQTKVSDVSTANVASAGTSTSASEGLSEEAQRQASERLLALLEADDDGPETAEIEVTDGEKYQVFSISVKLTGMYTNPTSTNFNANYPVCQTNTAAQQDTIILYNVIVSSNTSNNQYPTYVNGNKGQFNYVTVVISHNPSKNGFTNFGSSGSFVGSAVKGVIRNGQIILDSGNFTNSEILAVTCNGDGTATFIIDAGTTTYHMGPMSFTQFNSMRNMGVNIPQGQVRTAAFIVHPLEAVSVYLPSQNVIAFYYFSQIAPNLLTIQYYSQARV